MCTPVRGCACSATAPVGLQAALLSSPLEPRPRDSVYAYKGLRLRSSLQVLWLAVIVCCLQILRSKHQQHLAGCSRPKRPEGSHPRGAGRVTIEGMTELVSCPALLMQRAMLTLSHNEMRQLNMEQHKLQPAVC